MWQSLLLIDYLLKNGAEQVIRECRDNVIQIQTLTEFQHIDENDKDVGLSGMLRSHWRASYF
jgi:epsin